VVEVRHHTERVVEEEEQASPLLLLGRPAEAVRVVLEGVPLDEEEVGAGAFEASGEAESPEAAGGRDGPLGLREGVLELGFRAGPDWQEGVLEDHGGTIAAPGLCPEGSAEARDR
jgi:hypothetical protein